MKIAKFKTKLQRAGAYEWMENITREMFALYENVQGFSSLLYIENGYTAINIDDTRQNWSELLSNMDSVKNNYLTEFEGFFGTFAKDFLLTQVEALRDLVNEVDTWLESFRHDNLYVYKKRLEASELADLKAKIYESL
jgi:hypothetical protein